MDHAGFRIIESIKRIMDKELAGEYLLKCS